MSLVGTRPPTLDEWEKYEPHHRARMSFRPGLTGLWQVSGRSNITDFEEVVKLDTQYIGEWSVKSYSVTFKSLVLAIRLRYDTSVTGEGTKGTAIQYRLKKTLQKKSYPNISTAMLCNSDKCTGCECCYNICPTNSIVMTFNQYGESFPKINMNTCIQCGKCMKYCHVLCDCEKNESYKCFAAVRKDKNKRENCSSGGISSLLAEKVIGRDGVFYGVVFSRTDGAVYKRITSVLLYQIKLKV